jgi:protocatechuate 3,4-dioxygenase beta subunit
MKYSLIILLLAASIASAQDASPVPSKTPPEPCTISGRVVKRSNGEPLKSARLLLSENAEREGHRYTAFTDVNGRFVLKNIAPGRYDFEARRSGYVEQDYRPEGAHSGTVLELTPGQKLEKVLFRLTAAAAVVGKITDEDGDPVPAVVVQALAEELNGGQTVLDPIAHALTDDLGQYRLFGIPPGEYYFNTVDSGMPDLSSVDLVEGLRQFTGDAASKYPSIYYPGVFRRAQAQKITLRPGEEIHVDFTLRPAKPLTVAGVVRGPSGSLASGVEVYLLDRNEEETIDQFSFRQNRAHTDAKGRFQIENVLPADYIISATQQENEKIWIARQPLNLSSENIGDLLLVLKAPALITGKVIAQGTPNFAFQNIGVMAYPAAESSALAGTGFVQKDGTFKCEVLESNYRLTVQGMPDGWYLNSARMDGVDVLQHGLKIEGAASHKLEVQISHTAAHLEGTVMLDDKPAIGVRVKLSPVQENPNREDLFKTVIADQNGHFIITSIVPGTYKVQANFSEDETKEDPELSRKIAETTVHLEEKEAKTINLEMKEEN